MGITANLNRPGWEVSDGLESIIIVRDLADIPGGRTLDMTGFAADVVKAGHIIIKKSNGDYAPMPVSGDAYGALPEGAAYVGVLKASIVKAEPFAAILTQGQVNGAACAYAPTADIKNALVNIEFLNI